MLDHSVRVGAESHSEAMKFDPVINLNVAQACLSSRSPCAGCGIGSYGVPYPSLINYVTGTGPTDVASATGGCSCWLHS